MTTTLLLVSCSFNVGCPAATLKVIPIPSGTYFPALAHHHSKATNGPVFLSRFPRGARDDAIPESAVVKRDRPPDRETLDQEGEVIPSALLYIDRSAGVVTRTYESASGQTVEERWLITEAP